jgi:hypothetical protein
MENFKMSIILAILGSIIFSLVFILLAFVVPTANEDATPQKKYPQAISK